MPLPRLIPCLDVAGGRVVKGVRFQGLREVGDPVELGEAYSDAGADELVFLDVVATVEGRDTLAGLVRRVAERLAIPFTVGGGIRTVADADALLEAGADKVSVNSAALARPDLLTALAGRLGSQARMQAGSPPAERRPSGRARARSAAPARSSSPRSTRTGRETATTSS
jgi:imidazole glycerol-phosphate synthase subunit HisF